MPRPDAVYFFGTCLIDLFYPEAGLAGIRLLEREGIRVIYRQGQTCCGQPGFNSGHHDDARAVARAQMTLFPGDLPIVVPSGSCASMMRNHYRELFEGDQAAAAFCDRVHELTAFLVDVIGIRLTDRGEAVRVAWHASCHAMREMGSSEQPKTLLRQLSNVEIAGLSRERECCGFGGAFSVAFPEISAAMVADKTADIVATGAGEVLSADCGCLMNIGGALDADGQRIRARHIADFVWERTRER